LGFGSGSIAAIGSRVDEKVEEQLTEQVSEQAEEQIVEKIAELGFGPGSAGIGAIIEQSIEESVEEEVAESLEEAIVNIVEERIEGTTVDKVDDAVAENIEESIEESVTDTVEESISENIEQNVADTVESGLEETVEAGLEIGIEEQVGDAVAGNIDDQLENEIDDIIEGIESSFEIDEGRIRKGQWLVMAEPEVFAELEEEGYLFDTITALPGMGMWLADVAAPSSFDISVARQGVIDVVGSGRAEVDLNHIYTAGTTMPSSTTGVSPRSAMAMPEDADHLALRVGMIDSDVDLSHPALDTAQVHTRSFVTANAIKPDFHGTAIASIIAASSEEYVGLAPNSTLFAAAVFEDDRQQGEIASTISLIKALDWLVSSDVDVVNISLAGPSNRLLEAALKQVAHQDVLIVAAAGNGGPSAKPMYPAAYPSVIAITAVDTKGNVFRLANRGEYLDLAAPGVNLLHAKAGGGYTSSSGTSFAVPFAATAVARLVKLYPGDDVMAHLYASAEDLGPLGRDDIYGHGLLTLSALPSDR
jgi:subtilisin family serine protease